MNEIIKPRRRLIASAAKLAMPAVHLGRHRTVDVAFQYRMGAGFTGDVNRTHPFTVEPCAVDPTSPPLFYGQAVVIDATSHLVRRVLDGDDALTNIYGIAVRPYPFQDAVAVNYGAVGIGAAIPPTKQPIDVLRAGYIMAVMHGVPNKGDPVYVWADPDGGGEIAGQFTTTTTAGSTIGPLPGQTTYQGGVDSSGVGEVAFNI